MRPVLKLAIPALVVSASPYHRRGDSPCDSDDASDNAPTCPPPAGATHTKHTTSATSTGTVSGSGSGTITGTAASSTGTSRNGSGSGSGSGNNNQNNKDGDGGGGLGAGAIVGIVFAIFIGVASAIILWRTFRARRRARADEAALSAATAAALAEKRPPVPPKPANSQRSMQTQQAYYNAAPDTQTQQAYYNAAPDAQTQQAYYNAPPDAPYYNNGYAAHSPGSDVPSPLTPGFAGGSLSRGMHTGPVGYTSPSPRVEDNAPLLPVHPPARANTYPAAHADPDAAHLTYGAYAAYAEEADGDELGFGPLPNPYPAPPLPLPPFVSEKSAPVPSTLAHPRSRSVPVPPPVLTTPPNLLEADGPPSPSQWISRSPTAARFPSGASGPSASGSHPPSSFPGAEAGGSGVRGSVESASTGGSALLGEMTGHQKELEAAAYAGRASGRGSLEMTRGKDEEGAIPAGDAPPRYSR